MWHIAFGRLVATEHTQYPRSIRLLQPCRAQLCGVDVAPETLCVRTSTGMGLPVAAIDGPKDGAAFCVAVMAQVAKVKASGEQMDPTLREQYLKYSSNIPGGGMMGGGMMGGMMGNPAMQQMQQMNPGMQQMNPGMQNPGMQQMMMQQMQQGAPQPMVMQQAAGGGQIVTGQVVDGQGV